MKKLGQINEAFDFDEDDEEDNLIEKTISTIKNKEKIEKFLNFYGVENYTITANGIDVDGDVDLSSNHLPSIPYKFNRVSGNFNVSFNDLKSLKNSPNFVGKNFNCNYNYIRSFDAAPIQILGKFRGEYQKYGQTKMDNQFYQEWKASILEEEMQAKMMRKVRLFEMDNMFGDIQSISQDRKTCSVLLESGELVKDIPTDKVELIMV